MTEEEAYQVLELNNGISLDTDPAPIEGLELKSMWQNGGGRWLKSYKNTTENSKLIFESVRAEALQELKDFRPKQPKIKRIKTGSKKLHLLSLSDIHFGKEALGETGKRVQSVVDELLSRLDKKKDKEFLMIIGNDVLNTDFGQTTTKGTPQFNFSHPKDTFREATREMIKVIEKLLTLGTVHLIHVPSNHDYFRGTYLFDNVCNRYYNNSNVTFSESLDDRQYYKFGNNSYMFEHGELKVNDYEVIFATEAPEIFCSTTNRTILLGHLHHEQVHQKRGCVIRYLASLSASDLWHKKKGYISPQSQQLLVYDYEKGLETIHEVTYKKTGKN